MKCPFLKMKLRILGVVPPVISGETVGVPADLFPYIPTAISPDFGLFPSCELPRGSSMYAAGVCVPETNLTSLEFCGEFVSYSACVPPANPLWPAWTVRAKDELVKQLYETAVAGRQQREQASLTEGGYVPMLFTGNDQCVSEYKRIVCLYNFPSCNSSAGLGTVSPTFGVCNQRCADFFETCKLDDALITAYCNTVDSVWPLSLEDESNITSSSSYLVTQGEAECTGKTAQVLTYSIALVLVSLF